jgi:general secretion pathway protein J
MRMKRPLRRRARGFSLLEVVVATGIFALIAGVLFSALWTGRTQLARFERSGSDQERLLALRHVLTSLIGSTTVAGTDRRAAVYLGEGQRALFNATPGDRGQAGGLYRVELSIEQAVQVDGVVSKLILQRQALGIPSAPVETTELITLPRMLAFRYAAAANSNGQLEWAETWLDPTKLPTRVQLVDPDGPLMTVAILQSKDPRCILQRGAQMLAGGECLVR